MKKIIFSSLFILSTITPAFAGTVTITNQYPSPAGIYDWLQLIGKDTEPFACTPGNATTQGRFYVSTVPSPRMLFCNGVTWIPLSGPWAEDTNNNIFLSGANPENKKVGIGTAAPRFRLTLHDLPLASNPDGSILAKGTFGQGAALGTTGQGVWFIEYPRKSALRFVRTTGSGYIPLNVPGAFETDDNWIGQDSVAFGLDSLAYGGKSTISGGEKNIAFDEYCTVGGGENNWACLRNEPPFPTHSTVAGGLDNKVYSSHSFIGGGEGNFAGLASGPIIPTHITIGGGRGNNAVVYFSTIVGGENNTSINQYSFIGGGQGNSIGANDPFTIMYGTVGGGSSNMISDGHAGFIGGGESNVISNGTHATIAGGSGNQAQGNYATVIGGRANQANGEDSVAGGSNITVSALGTRTIAFGNPAVPATIDQADAVILLPQGNVGIGNTAPASKLDVEGDGRFNGDLAVTGNLGLGVAVPAQRLHVNGLIKLEPSAPPVCNTAGIGTIYRSLTEGLCYCGKGANIVALDGTPNCP